VKIFKEVVQTPEFQKDLKKLSKRFRSLPEDLDNFVRIQLNLYHKQNLDNGGIFQLSSLPFAEPKVYKAKKFACKALKGRGAKSGIRIIYAYFNPEDRVELVEIYFKGDQINEDRQRVLRLYAD
jgi:mRNA-degrading endonuclease RelE of RelBE toxin-antitoxin system